MSVLAILPLLGCSEDRDLPHGSLPPKTFFSAKTMDTRFYVADHFLTSIEMQISGEPFAQLLDRNLAGFDRFSRTTDQYIDPDTGHTGNDPLGYSTSVE